MPPGVSDRNMIYDWDGYEKPAYMGEEKVKDTWSVGRANNMVNKN